MTDAVITSGTSAAETLDGTATTVLRVEPSAAWEENLLGRVENRSVRTSGEAFVADRTVTTNLVVRFDDYGRETDIEVPPAARNASAGASNRTD